MIRRVFSGVTMAAVVGLPALRPASAGPLATPDTGTRTLVVSDQARRYLALQFLSYHIEFMGCMIGEMRGNTVVVQRIAPADVDPTQATTTHVIPLGTCEDAGWSGTVGMIHSHPEGLRCFYYFPGTAVATSDAESFNRQPYAVDAILCGDRIVWLTRDRVQHETWLAAGRPSVPVMQPPGNRVFEGSLGPLVAR